MKTFIKVTEIWIPDKERIRLELSSGLYGPFTDFKTASEHEHFAYNEGLPGKAWAAGHPIVMTRLEPSYFKRTAAAKKAGLTCGIALPIFSGDFLLAVVVFFCGDDEDHAGAIEVWCNAAGDNATLHLMDGYYGSLVDFENITKTIGMAKNQGLPGLAWATSMPVLMENIGLSDEFVRASYAAHIGITNGLAIPVAKQADSNYIMTFLSAKSTPLAKRIQIWLPKDDLLICSAGYSKHGNDLAEIFETVSVHKGQGALGRVWLTGMPSITGTAGDSNYNPALDYLNSMLAIPVIDQGQFKAIITFLF